ncbi:alpha/beta fold hydrolase [Sphingobium mellinum]|uniref:alpha/beta fold hydrolase n=1 Tax=Sphingobium mellinum TaxID=1387166 RepID=UPI0030EEEA7B
MPYVTVDGLRFHYDDDDFTNPWEERETILIQHGWGRSTKFFRHWVPRLADRYRIIRRDMRGHGLSDDPPAGAPWSVDRLVADMVGFLDALQIDKVHYLGESAGGVFGVALAAAYPDRVRSLTVMSAPLSDPTRGSESYGYADLAKAVSETPMPTYVDMLIKGGGVVPISPAHEAWMREQWCQNRSANLAALARLFPEVDLAPLLPGLQVPTLILAPANSKTAPLSDQNRMQQLIPGSRIEVIDGSGHELYFERFEQCIAAFQTFLASLDDGKRSTTGLGARA